jgi:SAM-dependent methyltransferase
MVMHLQPAPHHQLGDLGAGTGLFLQRLNHKIGFYKTPIAVEPDPRMVAIAKQRTGMRCIDVTAEEYLAKAPAFDRLILKMIHHIPDRTTLWHQIRAKMNPGGRALVMTRPQVPGLPFFDKAMEAFVRSQPALNLLMDEISQAGLIPEFSWVSRPMSLERDHWEKLLRNRFSSNLNELSDDDIEAGIVQMRQRFPGRVIEFHEYMVIICASHPEKVAVSSLFPR